MIKIVVDAMGTDDSPVPDVAGAVQASKEPGIEVYLVGPQDRIQAELDKQDLSGAHVQVVHASEWITMEDHTMAVKTKRDSSMVVGMQMLRRGEADAFVSAGNSGAVMAAALFHLGRLKGIQRPALAAAYPTVQGRRVVLDVGANTDCKPEYMYQFALMGLAYAERILGLKDPRVGLLSNGEEEGKGTTLLRDTYELFKKAPFPFYGNVEGRDIPMGRVEVVVSDGFTGNVVIKLSEGLIKAIAKLVKEAFTKGPLAKLGLLLMIPGLVLCLPGLLLVLPGIRQFAKGFSADEVGGAPLLGVRRPVIIAHGSSSAKAIGSAVRTAAQAVRNDMIGAIEEGLSQAPSLASASDG